MITLLPCKPNMVALLKLNVNRPIDGLNNSVKSWTTPIHMKLLIFHQHTKMLQANFSRTTWFPTDLFETFWDNETIPNDWDKGLIIKLHKKGNLHVLTKNHTVVNYPNVFCRIILCRIKTAIDKKRRGTTYQIFALRYIIE